MCGQDPVSLGPWLRGLCPSTNWVAKVLIEEFFGLIGHILILGLFLAVPTYWLASLFWKMGFEMGEAVGGAQGHQRAKDAVEHLGLAEGMDRIVDEAFLRKFEELVR